MLGDSHVAALRTGWKAIRSEFPDLKISFFATPGATLRGLAVSDGRLVAGTQALSGYLVRSKKKVTTIEPNFDFYVTCGLGLQLNHAAQAIRIFFESQRTVPQAEDELVAGICAALRRSSAAETLAKLRQITDAPIIAIPAPMHGAGRLAMIFQKAHRSGADKTLARAFAKACETVAQEHGAIFIPQPAETQGENAVSTDVKFATAPVKFFVYDLVDDMRHMNATYGEIMIRKLLGALLGQNRTG
jgi:hypothetical protein